MPPVLGICNVSILPDSAPAMLVTRVWNVILVVDVILLVQEVYHVISWLVNVPAIMVTQEPHATPVTPITTKQATVLHVQVHIHNNCMLKCILIFLFSVCGCDATGSSSLQCADSTGQCTCNAGYEGTKCDAVKTTTTTTTTTSTTTQRTFIGIIAHNEIMSPGVVLGSTAKKSSIMKDDEGVLKASSRQNSKYPAWFWGVWR